MKTAKEIKEFIDSFEQQQLESFETLGEIFADICNLLEDSGSNNFVESFELISYLLEARGNINGQISLQKKVNKMISPIIRGILYGFDSTDYFTHDIEEW